LKGPIARADGWYIRLLSSLYIATFLVRTSFAIIFIVFPIYLAGVEGYLAYALVLSLSPLFELVTVLGFGAWIDRYGRKAVLVGGAALSAGSLFLFAATDSPVLVALINGVHGISAAAILVSSLALIADYAPPKSRGREMGIFEFVQIFGWLAGFALGGVLAEVFEGELFWAFVIAGAMGAFGAVYALLNVKEVRRQEHLSEELGWGHLVSVLRQRAVVLLVLPWVLVYILISTIFTFFSKAGFEEWHLSGYQVTALLGGGGLMILATFVFFGRLSDRVGRMPVMVVGTIGMVGLMATLGVMFMTSPDGSDDPWDHSRRFVAPLAVFGLMAGAFGPSALASLADVSQSRKRGITMGLYAFVISAAMTAGPLASGAIIDIWEGAGVMVFLTACAALMAALVFVHWRLEARKEGAEGPRDEGT
jgi:MFS family permease